MTYSIAAPSGPSEPGWAVFVAGQVIRCPGRGRGHEWSNCRQGLGVVSHQSVVWIRVAPSDGGLHPPSITRICKACKSTLEQKTMAQQEAA
jgi:hypothetical protein